MKYQVIAVNNNDPLRLREKASTSAEILAKIPVGEVVDFCSVLEPVDGWIAVTWGGKSGYVAADYLAPYDGGDAQNTVVNNDTPQTPETAKSGSGSTILIVGAVAMAAGLLLNVFWKK